MNKECGMVYVEAHSEVAGQPEVVSPLVKQCVLVIESNVVFQSSVV